MNDAPKLKYRSDIDGLRAVAVLSVIAFHLDAPFATGGFVGVDLFFVISGYLVTQTLASEIDRDNYSLSGFYERRIRRIIPALFFMLLTVSILSFFIIIPGNYAKFCMSAAAAALSVSNIYFYNHSGYFDLDADYIPLLHTWSLGVEEQFYMAFPILFGFCRYVLRISWRWIILPLLATSFMFTAIPAGLDIKSLLSGVIRAQAVGNGLFYLPTYRAWEFLIGSAIAVGAPPSINHNRMICNALSSIGFLLIIISVTLFDSNTSFPMVVAVPCLGAGLIIYSNANFTTFIGRVLSNYLMVWTGIISYSLYLWHWPLLVFFRLIWGSKKNAFIYVILLMAMFFMAWLSWRFIERPVRIDRRLFTRRRLFAAAGGGALLFLGAAEFVNKLGGLPGRFSPSALIVADRANDGFPLARACDGKSGREIAAGPVCTIGLAGAPLSFALIGDSFANALSPGVADAADRAGRRGLVMTHGGCYALVGIIWGASDTTCRAFIDAAVAKIKANPSIHTVILVSRWSAAAEGSRFGGVNLNKLFITDDKSRRQSDAENRLVFDRALQRTAAALKGYKVFIVAYVPEQWTYVPQAVALRVQFGLSDTGTPRNIVENRQSNVRKILTSAASRYGFRILDAMPALCDARTCRSIEDGKSLYLDDNHLSRFGALKESTLLSAAFR